MNLRPLNLRPRLGAVLAIAGLLVASNLANAERVLCVGDDGHVSIEDAVGGACADQSTGDGSARDREGSLIHSGGTSHCGPCEDLPIRNDGMSFFTLRETPSKCESIPSPLVLDTDWFVGRPTSDRRAAAIDSGSHSKPPAAFLRSVCLQL